MCVCASPLVCECFTLVRTAMESVEDKKRRPRRSYNCGPCKKQKIKCDTNIPCGACARHSRVDQCLEAPPRPASPDHKKRVRKQSLSSFGDGNSRRSSVGSNTALTATATATSSNSSNSNNTTGLGGGGGVSDMRLPSLQTYTSSFKIDPLPQRLYQKPWEPFPTRDDEMLQLKSQMALLAERLAFLETKVAHTRQDSSFQECLAALPDYELTSKMVGFFKAYLNRPLEIVDGKMLDARMVALQSFDRSTVPTSNEWETVSLISMVVSLTALHYPNQSLQSDLKMTSEGVIAYANSLLQISKNSLNIVRYKESPRLIHAQILLLYDISLRLFNKKNLIMAMGSELVSMAYVLGLQTLKIPQNSLELDASHRVWWIICHNDTLNALKFSMPTLIRLDSLPKETAGGSHILKAFISAERTDQHSIITHIAKLTLICNEIPAAVGNSLAGYLESLIMVDRQLTSYHIPPAFSFLNPRNDIFTNFQCCYLNFLLIINRFRIYQRIYFSNPHNGIWFIMLSVIESFLKRYAELRKLYPPREFAHYYLQVSEFPITGTIINLIIMSTEPELLPQALRKIIMAYFSTILEDLEFFRVTIFNEKIPFYDKAFSTIHRLKEHMEYKHSSLAQEQASKQADLTRELKESRVFESMESSIGLIPTNDFFNFYFGSMHRERSRPVLRHSWRLQGVLDDEQLEFLSCLGV